MQDGGSCGALQLWESSTQPGAAGGQHTHPSLRGDASEWPLVQLRRRKHVDHATLWFRMLLALWEPGRRPVCWPAEMIVPAPACASAFAPVATLQPWRCRGHAQSPPGALRRSSRQTLPPSTQEGARSQQLLRCESGVCSVADHLGTWGAAMRGVSGRTTWNTGLHTKRRRARTRLTAHLLCCATPRPSWRLLLVGQHLESQATPANTPTP